MYKTIITILIITFLSLVTPQKALAEYEAGQSASLIAYNPGMADTEVRVTALKNIFIKSGSPLASEAENFVKYADKYGVDWKLLPAISGLESSFGIHLMPGSHNAYGWGGGYIYFDSWEEGISTITYALKTNYMEKWGAKDVWEIGPIYAESPTWAVRVSGIMDRFNKEYIEIKSEALTPTI